MRTILILILFITVFVSTNAQINDSINARNLSPVEISASATPSTTRSSTPLQVMTARNFEEQGLQSVSDAVKRFNGIVLKDYGGIGGLKTVSIRGMGAEHTAISYDGIMVSNMQSGQVDINRFSLDNISVLSLNIGQSDNIFQTAKAFSSAGVLNLQTITPTFFDKNYKGHLKVTGGSFGLFNPSIDYQQKISNRFIVTANINWQRADGNYPFTVKEDKLLPNRKRKNSDTNILRSEVNLHNNLGNAGNLKTKLYYYDSERGLPGSITIANDFAKERLKNRSFFIQSTYSKDFNSNFKFKSQAKYDNNYTRYTDTNSQYEEKYGSDQIHNKYTEQEAYWSNALLYTVNDKIQLSIAEDLSFNHLKNRLAKPLNDTENSTNNQPFPKRYGSLTSLAAQYKTQRLTATASLLMTYVSEKNQNNYPNQEFKKLSPSVGVSFAPFNSEAIRIRASCKHGFRIPTFTELYYSTVIKSLKPETANQFNIGITWLTEFTESPISFVKLSIDGYYNKIHDKIIIIPTMFIPRTMNLGEVEMKGTDINAFTEVILTPKFKLNIEGVYSYMKAIDATSSSDKNYKDQIPYTPEHSGSATVGLNTPWLNISYTILMSGDRYMNPQNIADNKVKGYTDHSISLYKQFKVSKSDLYLQGNIQNIGNKNYDIIRYYPMPGRSFKITAGYKF